MPSLGVGNVDDDNDGSGGREFIDTSWNYLVKQQKQQESRTEHQQLQQQQQQQQRQGQRGEDDELGDEKVNKIVKKRHVYAGLQWLNSRNTRAIAKNLGMYDYMNTSVYKYIFMSVHHTSDPTSQKVDGMLEYGYIRCIYEYTIPYSI